MDSIKKLFLNLILFMMANNALASDKKDDEYEFNSDFVIGSNNSDLNKFRKTGDVIPSKYDMEVYLNDVYIGNFELDIQDGKPQATICSDEKLLSSLKLKDDLSNTYKFSGCESINSVLPYAKYTIDFQGLTLNIKIPQVYLHSNPSGWIDPSTWKEGLNAGFINYNLNVTQNQQRSNKQASLFTMLNSGVNIGLWQFRDNSNYSHNEGASGKLNTINRYLQRPIQKLNSNLILGEYNTSGQYLDTINFKGFQLVSDDRMLPDTQQGFAPIIKGVAQTVSTVEVSQRGIVLYKNTVPQGPFLIEDLYPTGFGGELDVTITGADGSIQKYSVPYSSVPQLLREGLTKYSITLGRLNNQTTNKNPEFIQGWYSLGLTNEITGYLGGQLSKSYQSTVTGLAVNTQLGAFSTDITNSFAKVNNDTDQVNGWSIKASHSKLIELTNTYLSLSAYRFSSKNYLNFNDAVVANDDFYRLFFKQKSRFEMSINQPVNDNGSVFLSGSTENYWNVSQKTTYYQGGYNFNYKRASIGMNISHVKNSTSKSENLYSLAVSIPFGGASSGYSNLNTSYSSSDSGGSQATIGYSGVTGRDNELAYGLSSTYDSKNNRYFSGNLTNSYSEGQASFIGSKSSDYSQYSLGLSGSVVAHSNGLTFGQYSSDSFVLVEAKDATGAKIDNNPGIVIDRRGYAIIPYSNPYRVNDISIDPQGISEDTEFKSTSKKIVPYSGSIVKVSFQTITGHKAFIYTDKKDGLTIPIGAVVKNDKDEDIGMVGQSGVIYVSGLSDTGVLKVSWGGGNNESCKLKYDVNSIASKKNKNGIYRMSLSCIK